MPTHSEMSAQDSMLDLETRLRELCISFFPKRRPRRTTPSQLQSISSRMWHARREALRIQGSSLRALILGWMHVIHYIRYQK